MKLPTTIVIPIAIDQPLRMRNFLTVMDYITKVIQPEEIFIIEYSEHQELQWVQTKYGDIRYIYFALKPGEPFSRARSFNLCLDHVRHNNVMIWDADMMAGKPYVDAAVEMMLKHTPQPAVTFPNVKTMFLSETETLRARNWLTYDFKKAPELEAEYSYDVPCGINVFNTAILRHARGFSPLFTGWGAEDNEVKWRLSLFGNAGGVTEGAIVHLYHHKAKTTTSYGDPSVKMKNHQLDDAMRSMTKTQLCEYLGITENVGKLQLDLHRKLVDATVEVPR